MDSKQDLEPFLSAPIPLTLEVYGGQEKILSGLPSQDLWRNKVTPDHIQSFRTGLEILSYQLPRPSASESDLIDPSVTGYLVIQGRVRLLCESDYRQRPYSTTVLKVGDIFGADHWFFTESLSYSAIAASDCQVANISFADLTDVIEQYPELRSYWQEQMQQRAQRIFFKCFTRLQSLSSTTLSRLVLPRIREHRVEPGVTLRAAITPYEGYFWLRSGVLSCPTVPEYTLPIGGGWSDRTPQIAKWVAQTPSLIYQLRSQPWETAKMLPILEQLDSHRFSLGYSKP